MSGTKYPGFDQKFRNSNESPVWIVNISKYFGLDSMGKSAIGIILLLHLN